MYRYINRKESYYLNNNRTIGNHVRTIYTTTHIRSCSFGRKDFHSLYSIHSRQTMFSTFSVELVGMAYPYDVSFHAFEL